MKMSVMRLPHAMDLPLPAYASSGAAGLDLLAANDSDIMLTPGARAAIPCGIAIALPEGFEAQLRPRSGLAFNHGVTVLNTPGTIDSDYRGEVKAVLINHGDAIFRVARGMKIAQLVIARCERVEIAPCTELPATDRGTAGFGSTGISVTSTN